MRSIVLIVPYFGKLPYNFQIWLEGCRYNTTITWLVFTDDHTEYKYPNNVKVTYCTFGEMKDRIQSFYDFPVSLERPYKLCDYRPAYGEIFEKEISEYDIWGYCDVDLLFGNIREFLKDEILQEYEKVGFQGHLTLYQNREDVNKRYRVCCPGILDYKTVFTLEESFCFDEDGMDVLYKTMGIPVYKEVYFAHLLKYCPDFYLGHLPKEDGYKNEHQIFIWEKGHLLRKYVVNDTVESEEYMYIHFFCRQMKIKTNVVEMDDIGLIIYPNVIQTQKEVVTSAYIRKKAHTSKLLFKICYVFRNRNKISFGKIINYFNTQKKWKEK